MELIDNINRLLGDRFKDVLRSKSKVKIAASTISIFAFEALRKELKKVESFEFTFTSPTFVAASDLRTPNSPSRPTLGASSRC